MGNSLSANNNIGSRSDARQDSSSVKHSVQSTSNFKSRSLEDSGNINNKTQYENQFHSTFINYEDLASHSKSEFDRVKNSQVIVQYKNLKQLIVSQFCGSVKYLNVIVEVQDLINNQLNDLCFISTKYLPNIKQVNVIFTNREAPRQPPPEYIHIHIILKESLIFREVNFVCEDKEYLFQKKLQLNIYCGYNNNIEIINCNFDSVALRLWTTNKVSILNSSFKNVGYRFALEIWGAKSQVSIENIQVLNSQHGMQISCCENPIINNLKIEKFSGYGCRFDKVQGASLSNTNIVGGETGICFYNCNNFKISDCTIKDFTKDGMFFFGCENPILNQLKIEKFSGYGCRFQNCNGASLNKANIVGGETGINFCNCNNFKISDCTIEDFTGTGCRFSNVNSASLSNANIVGGKFGVYFYKCKYAIISDCTIKDFTRQSIYLGNSTENYKNQRSPATSNNNFEFFLDPFGSSIFSECEQKTPRHRLHYYFFTHIQSPFPLILIRSVY